MALSRPQNVGILAMDVYFPASCITQVRMPPLTCFVLGLGEGEGDSEFFATIFAFWVLCVFGFVLLLFVFRFLVWGREVYASLR